MAGELPGSPPSLEAEERAMRGGRGGFFVALVGVAVLALAGVAYLIFGGDGSEQHRALGRNVNALEGQHFRGFWGCVFEGNERIRNNEELTERLHTRASRAGARFAAYVRGRCLDKLEALETGLRALFPPAELRATVDELIAATSRLRAAWGDYLSHLEEVDGGYGEAAASARVQAIARGWYDFERVQAEIDRAVARAIGESR